MVCKCIKTLVSGVAFLTMTAIAAPAFAAGDILDSVGQPGAAAAAAPTATAQPQVVKRSHAQKASAAAKTTHKTGKRHHTVAKAKHPKAKKAKQKRNASVKHRSHKVRGA